MPFPWIKAVWQSASASKNGTIQFQTINLQNVPILPLPAFWKDIWSFWLIIPLRQSLFQPHCLESWRKQMTIICRPLQELIFVLPDYWSAVSRFLSHLCFYSLPCILSGFLPGFLLYIKASFQCGIPRGTEGPEALLFKPILSSFYHKASLTVLALLLLDGRWLICKLTRICLYFE